MKLVVGLGNPGEKYKNNRHNLGFMIVDDYVTKLGLEWKYSPDWVCFWAKNDNVVFVKPSTFMNKSGASAKAVRDYYKIELADILVISDEVDLPFAKIRFVFDGLSAGHKGVDSVISNLGGFEFARLRVGIGRPDVGDKSFDVSRYVLEDFSKEEKGKIMEVIVKCKGALDSFIADGIEATMNKFN